MEPIPQPQASGGCLRRVIMLAGALALVVVGFLVYQHIQDSESCVVGVTGTHALIQVTGAGAGGSCDQMVNGSNYEYHYSGSITEGPVCEYSFNGLRFDVYDQGITNSEGNALCKVLAQDELPIQTTPPQFWE